MSSNLQLAHESFSHAAKLYAAIKRHVDRIDEGYHSEIPHELYGADIAKKTEQFNRTLGKATEHVSNAETANESPNTIVNFWWRIYEWQYELEKLSERLQALHDR
jgi:hypothetical protein